MRRWWRWFARMLVTTAVVAWVGCAYWHTHKPLPPGMHIEGPWSQQPASEARFLADITTADAYGRPIESHAIFDEMLRLIGAARSFIVVDTYLFAAEERAFRGAMPAQSLSAQLRDALIARRQTTPGLRILFITDPLNSGYGAAPARDLTLLRSAGIDVVEADLERLRDANFLYSSLWRLALAWWTVAPAEGRLPNPLPGGPALLSAPAWARLMNFKADHRNVVLIDDARGQLAGLISSASPQRLGSADSNVAVGLRGGVLEPLLNSELSVARFSGWTGDLAPADAPVPVATDADRVPSAPLPRDAQVRVLTEGATRDALLERIAQGWRGESIDIAGLYLADRAIIDALVAASRRGVAVRLILDPNKEADGRELSGVPNRPAASELLAASEGAIHLRWYRTHGERFHGTIVAIYDKDRLWLTVGSANLTRRSLDDYDLEANAVVQAPRASALGEQVQQYFETLWSNRAPLGIEYTTDVGVYADASPVSYWRYRLMEGLGLSMF